MPVLTAKRRKSFEGIRIKWQLSENNQYQREEDMSRTSLIIKNTIKSFPIGKKLRDMYHRRNLTRKNAENAFDLYYRDNLSMDREKTVADMLSEAQKYSIGFNEYNMYHFERKTFAERREYVSDRERITYCERMNNMKNMILFDDKGKTYEIFKKYYHRDLLEIFGKESRSAFDAFIEKHPHFIVKPFDGACGIGIKIVDSKEKDTKNLLQELLKEYPKGFVAEELIIQHTEMRRLHPQSVNTLRMPAINYGDHVEILHPVLRIGRGDSIVDNGGSGGISCGVDLGTGVIYSAVDEEGRDYVKHPDTGVVLLGYRVPFWEEAKAFVCELAQVIPDNHYTGWDIALTDKGWVLQEGNDRGGFMLIQITTGKGFRPEIDRIIKKLGV